MEFTQDKLTYLANTLWRILFVLIVLDKCQDQRTCTVHANQHIFGEDPCPGTSKYLEVAYKCRPNEFRSRVTCEGDEMVLHCQKGRKLAIYSAMFGRSQRGSLECPAPPAHDAECQAPCSLEAVMQQCHGKKRCAISASQAVFGNPCLPMIPKYLRVVYTCVPKRILKEIKRNRDDSSPTSNYFCDPGIPDSEYNGGGGGGREDDQHNGHGGDHGTDHRDHNNGDGPGDNGDPDGNGWLVEPQPGPGSETGPDTGPGRPGDRDNHGGLDGEASYLPEPSTFDYSNVLTPITDPPHIEGTIYHSTIVCDSSIPADQQPPECIEAGQAGASKEKEDYIGFLHDWVNTTQFIKNNMEKFILYLVLSIMAGIILILLVIIFRLMRTKRQTKRQAKLDISEPVPNSTRQTEDFSLLTDNSTDTNGIEILSINHSRPPPFPTDNLDTMVSRNGSSSHRVPPFPTDTNTFRSDTATRSLNNYYG